MTVEIVGGTEGDGPILFGPQEAPQGRSWSFWGLVTSTARLYAPCTVLVDGKPLWIESDWQPKG